MLANAIFLTDPSQVDRKFRKTELYFDTPFLLFALGHAGEARRDPCLELLHLLYEIGADLRCFSHTLDEAKGVLDACAHRIHQGQLQDAYGPSIEYFLSTGRTASDIELYAVHLERDLDILRIQVLDKPSYIPQYVIDEQKLTQALAENIYYHNPQALQRDVDSVSAVMRLRRGQEFSRIEECQALFVTTNNALVKVSRDFFYEESTFGTIPPCIPDYVLTNLLWLKNPLGAPDLPRKRIIADYYAATQPQERLWKCYLEEIDRLEQTERVTADDYYLLRYSLEAKSALMELTLGEEEAFTQGTVVEMLALVRSRIQQEKDAEIKELEKQRNAAQQAIEAANTKERERVFHIRARAQRYARLAAQTLRVILLLVLVIGTVSTFPWGLPSITQTPLRYLLSFIQVGLLILSVANLMWGTKLATYTRKIEVKLAEWLERKLLELYQLSSERP